MSAKRKWIVGVGLLCLLGFGLLAGLIALQIYVYRQDLEMNKAIPKPKKNTAPDWQWMNVTAEQLVADYRANEIAADSKYKNQHLVVTGTIGRIASEYMTLEVSDQAMDVQCIYKPGKSGPESLVRGQESKVYGVGAGKVSNVILKNCGP